MHLLQLIVRSDLLHANHWLTQIFMTCRLERYERKRKYGQRKWGQGQIQCCQRTCWPFRQSWFWSRQRPASKWCSSAGGPKVQHKHQCAKSCLNAACAAIKLCSRSIIRHSSAIAVCAAIPRCSKSVSRHSGKLRQRKSPDSRSAGQACNSQHVWLSASCISRVGHNYCTGHHELQATLCVLPSYSHND